MTREDIRAIQEKLIAAGFNPGPADGHRGQRTDAALIAYAIDHLSTSLPPQRTSQLGLAATASYEGLVPGPYRDSVNVWTYGIGHTAAAGPPDPKAMPRGMPANLDAEVALATALYRADIGYCEERVRRAFTRPPTQHQFDAAVSFDLNTGAINRATWVKSHNAGNEAKAAEEIMNWRKPEEVIGRRRWEQRMYRDGNYPGTPIVVWGVDNSGAVIWRPVVQIEASDFGQTPARAKRVIRMIEKGTV